MGKRVVTNPKMKILIDFFGSQGVKFIDYETGDELTTEEDYEDKG